MPALRTPDRSAVLREPLRCRPDMAPALRCLHDTDRPFALVGAWAGGGALLGCSPLRVATDEQDPFALIAGGSGDAGMAAGVGTGVGGGWVGYLGYPLREQIEQGHPAPPRAAPLPRFVLAYYDHVVRCDAQGRWWFEALWSAARSHELEQRHAWWAARLAEPPPAARTARTSEWRLTPSAAGHAELVAACRERIDAGDLFQANLCAELRGNLEGSPLELFVRGVEALVPDRAAYLAGPWGAIVSLSPELFLERRGRRVRTAPIKGTRRRPADPVQADAERTALERSEKDRAENVMIVDLMRNDLGRVCEPGSIEAGPLAQARAHAGVWHLVSEVHGVLRPEVDDGALMRATFPPGSVTGAPKIAAMNVIAELESTARDVYTGAIGIVSPQAGLEFSVAIRTFEAADSAIRLGVGGGVVADSDPQAEAVELAVKASPLLEAIGARMPTEPTRRTIEPTRRSPGPRVRRLGPIPTPRPDPRDGVFETMLVQAGRAQRIELHLARLRASVVALYRSEPPDSTRREIETAARAAPGPSRLRVDIGPDASGALRVAVDARALEPVATVDLQVWTVPGGLGPHKWSDRRLIDAMETHSGGRQPLLVDVDGYVLETSRASVFALGSDGVLRTPPDDGRILPGIARATVLATAPSLGLEVTVAPLALEALLSARGVVLTSALRTVPVAAIEGRAIRSDPVLPSRLAGAQSAAGLRAAVP